MKEEWKTVEGFSLYEVSNYGRLRRKLLYDIKPNYTRMYPSRILKNTNKKGWYFTHILVSDSNKKVTLRIHRLVWMAFNGNIPKGFIVHHIDGNRQNNKLENLRLVSTKEHHCIHLAEHPEMCDGMNYYNKFVRPKSICQYSLDGEFVAEFRNAKEASTSTGVCQRNILQVCNKTEFSKGRCRKQAGGFIWRFKNEVDSNKQQ